MKRLFSSLSIFLLTSSALAAGSASLSDAGYLRKLSLHLRGLPPSTDEYKELKTLLSRGERDAFLRTKIDDYMKSQEYQDRLVFRLSELFAIRTPEIDIHLLKQIPVSEMSYLSMRNGATQDPLVDLFARLGRDNLSWDMLLTGKSYNLYPPVASSPGPSDFAFYQNVAPGLPEAPDRSQQMGLNLQPGKGIPLEFAADDVRIAGALTTPRFISRYNTTNVNKNRRRAAAVFRIFLCDPMFPIIPPPPDKKSAALDVAYDDAVHATVTEKDLSDSLTLTDAMRHGADPKCAACHYKLDPMGRTFQNIGVVLGPAAARGVLTFQRANGELVKTPLAGIGDLGREVAKQPEYVSCQIDWFWKQFIGANVPLTAERRADLTKKFEAVGRRTNDFIRTLVTSAEFRSPPEQTAKISFAQVAPLLQRCDRCHGAMGYPPPLAAGDIAKGLLLRVRHRINLPEGDPLKMPRDWMMWDSKDLTTLKTWLEQGGVNAKGETVLNEADLRGAK